MKKTTMISIIIITIFAFIGVFYSANDLARYVDKIIYERQEKEYIEETGPNIVDPFLDELQIDLSPIELHSGTSVDTELVLIDSIEDGSIKWEWEPENPNIRLINRQDIEIYLDPEGFVKWIKKEK